MTAFRRMLKSVFAPAPRTIRRTTPARLGLESLEVREVPAAVTAVREADGVLRITGTSGNDHIHVMQSDGPSQRIYVGSTRGGKDYGEFNFPGARVTHVEVVGGRGNDTIDLLGTHVAHHLKLEATVYGDTRDHTLTAGGNDTIIGGGSRDWIYAGGGKDTIDGRGGNDRLHGGYGDDTLSGSSGSDYLYGGVGNDRLDGGNQNDHLYGGTGNDVLLGGAGHDHLFGENGDDYLNGGAGDDRVDGGAGTDTFRRSLHFPGLGLTVPKEGDDDFVGPHSDYRPTQEADRANEPQMVVGGFLTEVAGTDDMADIVQEGSPTCAFLAALAAYARQTTGANDLVGRIRYDAARDEYAVPLFIGGAWQDRWVNGDWTEGRDPGGNLWVTLYQKAYLQAMIVIHRDGDRAMPADEWRQYFATESYQDPSVAMRVLTGRTIAYTATLAQHELAHRAGLAGTAGVVALSKDSGTTAGVVADHCYVVLAVGPPVASFADRKVTLYNPWGRDAQRADGTFHAITGANDGQITLTWAEFVANFQGYTFQA